jgi:preflagellin peptidase FlaK
MLEGLGDLLRLVAVPLFGWAALRDVRTRRVPNRVWYVLGGLGIGLLAVDLLTWYPFTGRFGTLRLIQIGVSVFFVAPLGYAFWRIGGFGGADAKALMVLAVLFPTYPTYGLPDALVALGLPPVLPVQPTALGVFSLTILTDTVLVGMAFPLVLAARNVVAGRIGKAMFFGRVVPVATLPTVHGRLFETREGFTRSGLDIDALRMYLRWRGCSLADLRQEPDRSRNPESVGETYPPTDGAVDADGAEWETADGPLQPDGGEQDNQSPEDAKPSVDESPTDGREPAENGAPSFVDDPWAADQFLAEIQYSAYGTDAETLREGLETVVERESVWISPGLPFIVPMFVGLVVALTYGDLLYGLLLALGMV